MEKFHKKSQKQALTPQLNLINKNALKGHSTREIIFLKKLPILN